MAPVLVGPGQDEAGGKGEGEQGDRECASEQLQVVWTSLQFRLTVYNTGTVTLTSCKS